MPRLSVIIVNYNVEFFLEQCLHSVKRAIADIDAEVFVVDNNSVDGSLRMLRDKFPWVKCIANKKNVGFSRANNQAIRLAKSDYVLLLNPDTVVENDTFSKVVGFMDEHPDAGGLGVKMVDGKGKFLPESKRGLPTPLVAFYKIFGLSRVFPRSKIFGKYHLGYLSKEEVNKIDVLSGAFMLLRKKALDKTGLLDEDFFMYGEDIDLSYRITQAGYANYYYPHTRIIHYKGESTKKSSINYVFIFYNAMVIFTRKHFSEGNARLFSIAINLAIYFRAFLSLISRFFKRILLPVADAALIFGGLFLLKVYWEQIIYPDGGHYPTEFISIAVPLYLIAWLGSVYFSGGYDKPFRLTRIFQGLFMGTLVILVFYALLSESYRFSRALILLGAGWGFLSMTALRLLLHSVGAKSFNLNGEDDKRLIVIGNKEESSRVVDLLRKTRLKIGFTGRVLYTDDASDDDDVLGTMPQLMDILDIYHIDEVIFCAQDIPANIIIDYMSEYQRRNMDFKIAPPESTSIIGSNSINTSGDLYILDVDAISKEHNKRNKRLFDILTSLVFIGALPILALFIRPLFEFIKNIFRVLFGMRSWVGFYRSENNDKRLPDIRKGILSPVDAFSNRRISEDIAGKLNLVYARDYKIINDINIIYRGYKYLGRA